MYKIVIVRHGLSLWPDRFTGWTDIDLAPVGLDETYVDGNSYCHAPSFRSGITSMGITSI